MSCCAGSGHGGCCNQELCDEETAAVYDDKESHTDKDDTTDMPREEKWEERNADGEPNDRVHAEEAEDAAEEG